METRSPRKPNFVGPEATTAPSASPSLPLPPLRNPDPPGVGDVVGPTDDATAHRVTPMSGAPPLATRNSPTPLPSPLIHIWGPGAISTHIRRHVMTALMGAELTSWLMTPTPRPIFSAHAHLPYGQARLVRYDPPPPHDPRGRGMQNRVCLLRSKSLPTLHLLPSRPIGRPYPQYVVGEWQC